MLSTGIVEANPKKFKLDENEISNRRQFIVQTKEEVKSMRDKLAEVVKFNSGSRQTLSMIRQSNLANNVMNNGPKYMRLENNFDIPRDTTIGIEDSILQQSQLNGSPDHSDPIGDRVREGVGVLKSNNRQFANEADEQAV